MMYYKTEQEQARIQISFSGGSHRKRTRLIIRYFDFRISMDVSLLQEKSTFPVLTMRMSPHLEPFFFLIYDCILHKCCAISNQYHFTNPISTFLPKFQGGGPDPRSPPLDPPMKNYRTIHYYFIVFAKLENNTTENTQEKER